MCKDEEETKLYLPIVYIVDAIINVKIEKFGERFVSVDEVLVMKKIMELRLAKKKLKVEFRDEFLSSYFRVDNDVITKCDNDIALKDISDEEVRQVIYDEKFIYYCLCQMLINKLNNSMEHSCNNCNTLCLGLFNKSHFRPNNCIKWTHDFIDDCKDNISEEELILLTEEQAKKVQVKSRYSEEHMARINYLIRKDWEEE